jgi:hypothetical protein
MVTCHPNLNFVLEIYSHVDYQLTEGLAHVCSSRFYLLWIHGDAVSARTLSHQFLFRLRANLPCNFAVMPVHVKGFGKHRVVLLDVRCLSSQTTLLRGLRGDELCTDRHQMFMLEISEFVMYTFSCNTRPVVSVIFCIRYIRYIGSSLYTHLFNKCSIIVLLSLKLFNGLEPTFRGSSLGL